MADMTRLAAAYRAAETAVLAIGRFTILVVTSAAAGLIVAAFLDDPLPDWLAFCLGICSALYVQQITWAAFRLRSLALRVRNIQIEVRSNG